MTRLLLVAGAGFVAGGWAVPLGFLVGLGPVGAYLSAAVGGVAGCWLFLALGDRVRDRIRGRWRGDRVEPSTTPGRARAVVERWGEPGLGLVGPVFPGVTASVAAGLALGCDRARLGRWMSGGIVVLYAVYALGTWALVSML